jgi:hypothetical protein
MIDIWGRLRREERGVSAVLVGVSLIAIFGAAVLSIDAGSLWATRRNMITATDAAALGQARTYSLNPPAGLTDGPCPTSLWSTILANNINDTFSTACTLKNISSGGGAGVVIVSGQARSPAKFSGALGIGDSSAFSQSAAMWGYVPQPSGLRPIGLCTSDPEIQDGLLLGGVTTESHIPGATYPNNYWAPDNSQDYAELHGHGPTGATAGVVHHLAFTASCGGPGNFGWVDLNQYGGNHSPQLDCSTNGNNNGNCTNENTGDISQWLRNGYYGNNVDLTNSDCDTQDPATAQPCVGDPGTRSDSNTSAAMDYLVQGTGPSGCTPGAGGTCVPFAVPIILYDTVSGSGSNAQMHLVGVAFVRIWKYNLPNGQGGGGRYLDLEFTDGLAQGVCCSASPPNSSSPPLKGERICDVDHDPADPSSTAAQCQLS